MSDPQPVPPVNSDLLCVTPQHEDEGYLSPSEEDLKRSFVSKSTGGGFLNCKPPNFLGIKSAAVKTSDRSSNVEDEVPWWEELTSSWVPPTKVEHLNWDRLKLPVPYRFYEEHRSCLRQVRTGPSTRYLTDDTKNHAEISDQIWRSYELGPPRIKPGISGGKEHEVLRKIRSVKEEPVNILPKQFVQHIFHLLCGRESLSFSRLPGDRYKFIRNPKIIVTGMSPGLVASLSEKFLVSGRIYKRLSHVSALHYDEKLMDREGFGNNAVITAFLKFTSDYLKLYQTSLMLNASCITSFGVLNIFFTPFHQQLATLEKILDLYLATDQLTLLKGLNTMMLSSEIPHVADLLRSAFITCAAAYLRYVADWVFREALTSGFHIQRTKAFNYQDRRYWVKQFSQLTAVPKFLENAVNIIFETGKAINLLNLIRNTEPRTSLLSCILNDEGTMIHPAVEFSEITLLEQEWRIKLESFFEEYSFLQEDIASALMYDEAEDKNSAIDFDAIEAAKKSFEQKNAESKRQILDRKLERQKYLYDMLSQQLAEKKDRKKLEMEKELLEDEKISDFINQRDQRELEEEIRLKKKHFGEKLFDTVGMKNIKERIAVTKEGQQMKNYCHAGPVDDSGCVDSPKNSSMNDVNENTEGSEMGVPDDDIKSQNLSQVNEDDLKTVEDCFQKKDSLVIGTPLSVSLNDTVDTGESNSLCDYAFTEDDRKFNPSKIKVRDVIPYNTSLDFNSTAFAILPQPILKLRSSSKPTSDTQEHLALLRHNSVFLNYFFEQSVVIPVAAQNRMVNSTLLHYFIVEKKLFHHIEALNSYLCLQNGLFGHFLTTLFIQEIKNGTLANKDDIPRKATRLNEILGEAIALSAEGSDKSEIRDNLGFILVRESGNRNSVDLDNQKPPKSRILSSNYEILDEVTLNYSVEWPLSILLTDDLLINYEKLFTFLMKLYRAELLLLEMSATLKLKGKTSNQLAILHQYRHRMLHFVRSVRHYINVTVIHCAWTELVSSFHKMNSLDKLYEGLVRHIKFVTTNCLLGAKGEAVKKLLVDQLIVIECFCEEMESCTKDIAWDAGEEIHPRRFNNLIKKFYVYEEIQKVFLQVFFKLAEKRIYQKVSYFLQLFNFNEYFGNNSIALSAD